MRHNDILFALGKTKTIENNFKMKLQLIGGNKSGWSKRYIVSYD